MAKIIDGHRLEIDEFPLDYSYELEPRIIKGVRYFEYGIDATARKQPYAGFILHHTSDRPFEETLDIILRRDKTRKGTFGYHFLIGRDGKAVQAAPLTKRTNHIKDGGKVRIAAKHLLNRNSIGISLHGGYSKSNEAYIPPTETQLDSAKTILQALSRLLDISLKNSWGHGEIQSNRMEEEGKLLADWCRSQG